MDSLYTFSYKEMSGEELDALLDGTLRVITTANPQQALEAILHGPGAGASLTTLLVCLPRHSAAILRHTQSDPSCKLCSTFDDSSDNALRVLHALNQMTEAASYSQLQELLLRLLQMAASRRQCSLVAEGAALAIISMCYAATASCSNHSNRWVYKALTQPRSLELLQQALRSSSSLVATAASSTVDQLFHNLMNSRSTASAVPAHAAALQVTAQVLQHGSNSAKASAAEYCWLASQQDSSAVLLMSAAADALTAAVLQPVPAPWVVFALAALCKMRVELDEHLIDPHAFLQLWFQGDWLQNRLQTAAFKVEEAEQTARAAAKHAAEAAAAGDAAGAVAAQQKAAQWAAKVAELQQLEEQVQLDAVAAAGELPHAAVLLRCVLQALGGCSSNERLAAAACQALNTACIYATHTLLRPALKLMHDECNQQEQQQQQKRRQRQQQDEDGGSATEHQEQQQQQQAEEGRSPVEQQHQRHFVMQLLLACAPELALLPQSSKYYQSLYSCTPSAEHVGALWTQVVAAAPAEVLEAVQGRLLQQLLGAASGCSLGGSDISSSSNTAHNAARLLHALQGIVPAVKCDPGWTKLLDPKLKHQLALRADPAAAAAVALLKLQQAVLLQMVKRWAYLPNATAELMLAALQQQLQAALAGDSHALELIDSLLCSENARSPLLQFLPALVAVLQAEPWLQAQQQDDQQQALQLEQQNLSAITALYILCKLRKIQQPAADVFCKLPVYLQQLLLGAAASSSGGHHTEEAATAAAHTTVAAATSFLRWLLVLDEKHVVKVRAFVLDRVAAGAPALLLAALQQQQNCVNQQPLVACLLLNTSASFCITLLVETAAAAGQQPDLQRLVSALVLYISGIASSSSSSDASEMSQLAAAAAEVLCGILEPQRSTAAAVTSMLVEQHQLQLLLQVMRQASGSLLLCGAARLLHRLCEHSVLASHLHMTTFLQELVALALEQGNDTAVKLLAGVIRAQPVRQQLLCHTVALLQAVQPGRPRGVQAAAWQLLEAWTGTDDGRSAVLQQDWTYILDVMTQQGSWTSSDCATAAAAELLPAAAAAAAVNAAAPQGSPSSHETSTAEVAAHIMKQLSRHEAAQQQLQTEGVVKKLLLAAMPPGLHSQTGTAGLESLDGSLGSSSIRVAWLSCSSTSSNPTSIKEQSSGASIACNGVRHKTQSAASSSSSSSTGVRSWSSAVALKALDIVMCQTDNDAGLAAALQHVPLLLSAMLQQQDSAVADLAGDFVQQLVVFMNGAAAVCTADSISKLAAGLQRPASDLRSDVLARRVAEVLAVVANTAVGRQLLAEQSCFDALVRATQHRNEHVAVNAIHAVVKVAESAFWLHGGPMQGQQQADNMQVEQHQILHQQQQLQQPAELPVAQQEEEQHQQQQQQQQLAGTNVVAAAVTSAPALVLEPWHVHMLAQAAQDPVPAGPAIMTCMFIADSGEGNALLLASYRGALLRAVRRLRGFVGLDWEALNPDDMLPAEELELLSQLTASHVRRLRRFVQRMANKVQLALAHVPIRLVGVAWAQQAAAVEFAVLHRSSSRQQQGGEGLIVPGNCKHSSHSECSTNAAAAGRAEAGKADQWVAGREGIDGVQQLSQGLQQFTGQAAAHLAALDGLVFYSKQRTDLQEVLQTSCRQL